MAHPSMQYLTSEYLAHNPTWDMEDAPWKAGIVKDLLARNNLNPASICEVCCGSGACLAELRSFYPETELSGYDIAPDAARLWSRFEDRDIRFEVGDVLTMDSPRAQVIMLLDVIEHLADPHAFLAGLRGKAEYYVFHIPLDLSAISVFREAPLLYVRNKVGHIHYFTRNLALSLLQESGYEVVDENYTQAAFTVPTTSWKTRIARPFRRIIYALLGKDRGVRLVGGETLIVLARAEAPDTRGS